jgi:hypothetical protein
VVRVLRVWGWVSVSQAARATKRAAEKTIQVEDFIGYLIKDARMWRNLQCKISPGANVGPFFLAMPYSEAGGLKKEAPAAVPIMSA